MQGLQERRCGMNEIEKSVKISSLQEVIEAINYLFNEYLTDDETSCFEKAIEYIKDLIDRMEGDAE